MSDASLKKVMGGVSAAMINALSRAASVLLGIGQIVGTALRKCLVRR